MDKAIELKIAEFAKATRVNRTKLTALIEDVLSMTTAKVSKRDEKLKTVLAVFEEKGKVTVKELEKLNIKSVRYMLSKMEAEGLIKKADTGVKFEVKGRPNYLFEKVEQV